jgi:hypothetical protein
VQPDVFGNLNRRSGVLAKLDELTLKDRLDQHQVGLARILRFRRNQNLLYEALEYANKIEKASDILIAEVLNVLVSQDLPIITRALAARVLGYLICRRPTGSVSDFDLDMVTESMVHVLSKTEAPALQKALREALGRANHRKRRRSVRIHNRMQRLRL